MRMVLAMPDSLNNPVESFVIDSLDPRVHDSQPVSDLLKKPSPQPLVDPRILDPYSFAFHDFLFLHRPEWRALAQVSVSDDGASYLYLEVASPSPRLRCLWISTEDGRVTVGIDEIYHAHFATYEPHDDAAMFENALRFADDFVKEMLVLLVAMHGVARGASWIQSSKESLVLKESFRNSLPPFDRVCSYSWNSTFDRDIAV
jgi:hypothetical protein